jgi:hypothetical protein
VNAPCALAAALEEAVGSSAKSNVGGRHATVGWAAAWETACSRCGSVLHDAGGQSHGLAPSAAVPAKTCLQTRWDSDLVSPPVRSCNRPPNSHRLPIYSSAALETSSSFARPAQPVPRHPHAVQSFFWRTTNTTTHYHLP